MSALSEYRKVLKAAGYKVSIKSFSFGRNATYTHIESSREFSGNCFTPESLAMWNRCLMLCGIGIL